MSNDSSSPPPEDRARRLLAKVIRVINIIRREEESLLDTGDELDSVRLELHQDFGEGPPGSIPDIPEVSDQTPGNGRPLQVSKLQVPPPGKTGSKVRMDDGEPFHLSPRLAQLLAALASGTPEKPGGPVPFKPYGKLADLIDIKPRANLSPDARERARKHAVEALLSRLRKAFLRNKLDPHLIESRRGAGARLVYVPESPGPPP